MEGRKERRDPETSAAMLRDLSANENSSRWTEFANRYIPLLKFYLADLSRTFPSLRPDMYDDIVQETLIALAKSFPQFKYDPAKGAFRGYLRRILQNKVHYAYKRDRRALLVSLDDASLENIDSKRIDSDDPVSDRMLLMQELWANALKRVFAKGQYSGTSQAIFRQIMEAQLSVEEIALMYGIKANAVYQIKKRVIESVKKELAKQRASGDDLIDLLDKLAREEIQDAKNE